MLTTMLLTRLVAVFTGRDILRPLMPQVTATLLIVQVSPELMTTGVGTSIASVPKGLPLGMVSCTVIELLALFTTDDMLTVLAVNSAVWFMVSVSKLVED